MRVRRVVPALLMVLVAALAACADSPTGNAELRLVDADFQTGTTGGWTVEFADYPAGDEEIYQLESGVRALPAPLDTSRRAIYVAGMNRSDDLFMYLKRPVDGLEPGATYTVRYEIQFASDAGSGCVGIGGAPGESVYVKAGASTTEPRRVLKDGFYEVSVDKGQQSVGGPSIPTIGDVANGGSECSEGPFRLKQLNSAGQTIRAAADAQGRLWLIVGTDSGFEGLTRLYYTTLRATLERR